MLFAYAANIGQCTGIHAERGFKDLILLNRILLKLLSSFEMVVLDLMLSFLWFGLKKKDC